jgi:hypothetical protein
MSAGRGSRLARNKMSHANGVIFGVLPHGPEKTPRLTDQPAEVLAHGVVAVCLVARCNLALRKQWREGCLGVAARENAGRGVGRIFRDDTNQPFWRQDAVISNEPGRQGAVLHHVFRGETAGTRRRRFCVSGYRRKGRLWI